MLGMAKWGGKGVEGDPEKMSVVNAWEEEVGKEGKKADEETPAMLDPTPTRMVTGPVLDTSPAGKKEEGVRSRVNVMVAFPPSSSWRAGGLAERDEMDAENAWGAGFSHWPWATHVLSDDGCDDAYPTIP